MEEYSQWLFWYYHLLLSNLTCSMIIFYVDDCWLLLLPSPPSLPSLLLIILCFSALVDTQIYVCVCRRFVRMWWVCGVWFFFHFSFFFNWIDLGAFYIDPNESGSNGVWHVTILAKMYDGEPHLVVGYGCAAARQLWMPKGGFGSMQQLSISICQAVPGRISISTRPKTPTIGSVETDQLEISRSDWIIDSADESYLASVVLSWFLILINTHTPQCCIKLERLHCICLRGSNWAVLIRVYCETKLEKKIFNNKQNNIGWYIVICPFSHNIWKECRKQSPSAHAVIHFW